MTIKQVEQKLRELAHLMSSPEDFIVAIQQGLGARNNEGERLPIPITFEERKNYYYSNELHPLYRAMCEWLEANYDMGWFHGAKEVWQQEHRGIK
jgi:hypothetical protein